MITAGNIVDFMLLNRGTTTFMDMDESQIAFVVDKAIKDQCLLFTRDNEQITGLVIAEADWTNRILFVTENLSMNLTNLKRIAEVGRLMFPDFTIKAIRHGHFVCHDFNKILAKL
jgi:hypothetical protein